MKKLLLLALTAMMMVGCRMNNENPAEFSKYVVLTMDSCEYIRTLDDYGFQHKGNCKYCAERRKQELKELVKQLKR